MRVVRLDNPCERKNRTFLSRAICQEARMRQAKILPRAALFIGGIGLIIAVSVIFECASAPTYYQCPDGYSYDPVYGCEPLPYFYGPPTYVYPDTGFGFFYGGGWGRGFRYGGVHPGGRGHFGGG